MIQTPRLMTVQMTNKMIKNRIAKHTTLTIAKIQTSRKNNLAITIHTKVDSHHPEQITTGAHTCSYSPDNWRSDRNNDKKNTKPAKNPTLNGRLTRCDISESVNHWAQNCPDRTKRNQETYVLHEVVLHQDQFHNPEQMKTLVPET